MQGLADGHFWPNAPLDEPWFKDRCRVGAASGTLTFDEIVGEGPDVVSRIGPSLSSRLHSARLSGRSILKVRGHARLSDSRALRVRNPRLLTREQAIIE